MFGARITRVIGPAGLALRDVQSGPIAFWVVEQPTTRRDDVASLLVDLSQAVVAICCLDLPSEEKDALLGRLDWRLRDCRAPR